MGEKGSLRHVVHKRVHLERGQPLKRKKLGHLEKHKDYVLRARDYHKKQDAIKKMHRKAYFRNAEEFSFIMLKYHKQQGVTCHKPTHLSKDELQVLESQDAKYVTMREQIDRNTARRMSEKLHFLGLERQNKHTIFVDKDDLEASSSSATAPSAASSSKTSCAVLQGLDIPAYFDTAPAVMANQSNRLRRSQLAKARLADPAVAWQAQGAYSELLQRQKRAVRLRKVRQEFETLYHLRKKGKCRKVADATATCPKQYKWQFDRKR